MNQGGNPQMLRKPPRAAAGVRRVGVLLAWSLVMAVSLPVAAQDWGQRRAESMVDADISGLSTWTRDAGDRTSAGSAAYGDEYATDEALDEFRLRFDPQVSEEARMDYLRTIRQTYGDRIASAFEAEYERKGVRRAFDEIVGPYGLHGDDYGDVFAGYVLAMWMIANQTAPPDPRSARAVAEQARWVLGQDGLQRSWRDRQYAAESMMYETVSAIYGRQEAERVGDVETLDRMSALARRKFLRSNMDLTDMVLSDEGLVRR